MTSVGLPQIRMLHPEILYMVRQNLKILNKLFSPKIPSLR
jgi:hypothetical protein